MAGAGGSRRFAAEDAFAMPDLDSLLPPAGRLVTLSPEALRFTYYDTEDLRLARAGVSLWFQRVTDARLDPNRPPGAENAPWMLAVSGTRTAYPGSSATVPARVAALVTIHTRHADLAPVAVLRYSRVVYELRDRRGRLLAGVVDDRVSVLEHRRVRAKFRQLRVERELADPGLIRALNKSLRRAGASDRAYLPAYVRALGAAAQAAPDIPAAVPIRAGAGAAEALINVLRRDVARIFENDPLTRMRDVDGMHDLRTGVRRLRSDLKTFSALLDRDWCNRLRGELAWLGSALGAARDAVVLRMRLPETAELDPAAPIDRVALARIDADLAARSEDAMAGLDVVLASPRYLALVDELLIAANDPPIVTRVRGGDMNHLVARAYHRLVTGDSDVPGAGHLARPGGRSEPDDVWHAVRKRAKAARYAADAAADLDDRAPHLAHALADVTDVLGEHQDAVMAAATWLSVSTDDPDDHALAIAAGRLAERERAQARRARERYPEVWNAAGRARLIKWLR